MATKPSSLGLLIAGGRFDAARSFAAELRAVAGLPNLAMAPGGALDAFSIATNA